MPDLDQGGVFRTRSKVYMGPSIGWIDAVVAIQRIVTAGTTIISLGTGIVTVNVNASVTVQLPVFKGSTLALAVGQPGSFVPQPLTIMDEGGFAGAFPITILPAAGETISGFSGSQVQISSPNGGLVLQPDPINGGCTVVS